MNPPLEPTVSDLYLALCVCFGVTAVVAGLIALFFGWIWGRRTLRRLIAGQRQRLSVVRKKMRVGIGSVICLLVLSLLLFGLCWWVGVNYLGDWVQQADALGTVARALLHTWGTLPLTSGSFIPWGCLGTVFVGTVIGGYLGLRSGRHLACRQFDLTQAI